VSALNAWSPVHALYEWSMLLMLLLAAALLAGGLSRAGESGLLTVLRCVGVACSLYSLRVLLVYAAALANTYQLDMHELGPGFSNIRFLNHTQTVLLPLIVLLHLQTPARSALRWAWFALAAFWWSLLFVSESRATLLALSAGCAAVLALRRGHARSFLTAMVLSALAGAVVYLLGFVLLPMLAGLQPFSAATNVLARTAADPSSRRNLLWQLCFELISAHPWLGVGPQHFAHEGATLSWGAHPHDFVLQIGAEWGLPALACLLGAIGIGMRGLLRSGARIDTGDLPRQQILAALVATGSAILVDGLFSGVIVMPQSQMAIVLYLGCAAGWVKSLDPETKPRSTTRERWLMAALAAVAVCGLAVSVGPSAAAHALHKPSTPAELAANPDKHWPRLWAVGYF
jgi:O-antigen ligase